MTSWRYWWYLLFLIRPDWPILVMPKAHYNCRTHWRYSGTGDDIAIVTAFDGGPVILTFHAITVYSTLLMAITTPIFPLRCYYLLHCYLLPVLLPIDCDPLLVIWKATCYYWYDVILFIVDSYYHWVPVFRAGPLLVLTVLRWPVYWPFVLLRMPVMLFFTLFVPRCWLRWPVTVVPVLWHSLLHLLLIVDLFDIVIIIDALLNPFCYWHLCLIWHC